MAQTIAQAIATKKAKRHAISSMRTKKTAEMQIHDENKMATKTDQQQQQLQLNLPLCNNQSVDKNNQNKLKRL